MEESAFSLVMLVYSPKLRLGSRVSPKILEFFNSWNDDIVDSEVQCGILFTSTRCEKSGGEFIRI